MRDYRYVGLYFVQKNRHRPPLRFIPVLHPLCLSLIVISKVKMCDLFRLMLKCLEHLPAQRHFGTGAEVSWCRSVRTLSWTLFCQCDRGLSHLLHSNLNWLDITQWVRYKLGLSVHQCLQYWYLLSSNSKQINQLMHNSMTINIVPILPWGQFAT